MNNYTSFSERMQFYLKKIYNGNILNDRYVRISSKDLKLGGTRFFIFSRINTAADFQTKIADFTKQKRYCRASRSRRQISRHVSALKCSGRIAEIRPNVYQVSRERTARPVNIGLAWLITDKESATMAKIILWLAFIRGKKDLAQISVCDAQAGLKCDRGLAVWIARFCRSWGARISQARLRRQVFYCRRPAWQLYRRRPAKKNFAHTRSDCVIAEPDPYILSRKGSLTCSAGGRRGGIPPGSQLFAERPELPGSDRKRNAAAGRRDLSLVSEIIPAVICQDRSDMRPARQSADNHFPINDYRRITLYGKNYGLASLKRQYQSLNDAGKRLIFEKNHDFLKQLSPQQKKFFFS